MMGDQIPFIAAAFVVTIVGIPVWRYIVLPLGRMTTVLVHLRDAWPVLEQIADEFKPDSGNSLRDRIDTIEVDLRGVKQSQRDMATTLNAGNSKLDEVLVIVKELK